LAAGREARNSEKCEFRNTHGSANTPFVHPGFGSWSTVTRPKRKDKKDCKDFKDEKDERKITFKVCGFAAIERVARYFLSTAKSRFMSGRAALFRLAPRESWAPRISWTRLFWAGKFENWGAKVFS
jgi:hypothetical protein